MKKSLLLTGFCEGCNYGRHVGCRAQTNMCHSAVFKCRFLNSRHIPDLTINKYDKSFGRVEWFVSGSAPGHDI